VIVLGGVCVIAGAKGTRKVPAEAFCTGPGKNVLEPGEILVAIEFPARPSNGGSHYRRLIPRNEMDIAVVGVAAAVALDSSKQKFESARIALGAVAPTPILAKDAGDLLAGKPVNDETIAAAAEAARKQISPISDMRGTRDYRLHVTGVLVERVLKTAIARARGEKVDTRPGHLSKARETISPRRLQLNPEFFMAKKRVVSATINGDAVEFLCEPRQTLLETLRDTLDLTGTKEGCSNGNCGACTVLMNGRPVVSCLVLALEADGAEIRTIEGVACGSHLDEVQQSFLEGAALQCGICTPGFIVQTEALLEQNPNPSEQDIRFYLSGNLCRCTGYDKIVKAVQSAARKRQTTKS
jgi:xanthine dehydrogenase iron-sulfur cluster and FAD-binding subunit A